MFASLDPLRERPFRLLFLGRTLSGVGDAIVPVALTFAVLAHGSASDLGIVLPASAPTSSSTSRSPRTSCSAPRSSRATSAAPATGD